MLTKTLNVPSTMVAARMKSSKIVLSAIESHGQQMAKVLDGKYFSHLEEGQVMPFETQLRLFEKELIRLRDRLVEAERRNRTQKVQETKARTRRDEDVKEVNAKVGRVRRTFSGVFDDDQMVEIGLSRRNARRSEELLEQAAFLAANLRRSDLDLSGVQLQGIVVDPPTLAEDVEPAANQLHRSLVELRREERQTEATMLAKNEAMEEYNHGFLWIARSVESLLQLAGLEELAARVRPSARRPGVTEGIETGTESDDSTTEGDSPEAVTETPKAEGVSIESDSEVVSEEGP